MLHHDVLRSFGQGLACAAADDLDAEHAFAAAVRYAMADYGVSEAYVRAIVEEQNRAITA